MLFFGIILYKILKAFSFLDSREIRVQRSSLQFDNGTRENHEGGCESSCLHDRMREFPAEFRCCIACKNFIEFFCKILENVIICFFIKG